ncbi:hypothetical protein [Consotaella salsifontis]|uniref:Uncharacterized protein n=1 Tax=Consotaella salsifontis TaxID=1365950 RepID=A0A1T4SSS3_9HYPH|nr:hypothetical protein [Consotaella salsifontis]SKA30928.1 hypothetical protein SAMN05428963_11386 [Consotaella salsifontis]
MTANELMAAVVFMITVFGAIGGFWWRIDGRIRQAEANATKQADSAIAAAVLARSELAEHRLHVAETYVSKAGHREATEQIMSAISSLGSDIRDIRARLDRWIDPKH